MLYSIHYIIAIVAKKMKFKCFEKKNIPGVDNFLS